MGRVVGVFVRVDGRAVDGFIDQRVKELVGRIGVIFARSVAVGDALKSAVVVVGVRGGHAVGEDVDEAADAVVDLDRDIALGVDGGFGRAAGVESVGDVVVVERGSDVGHGLAQEVPVDVVYTDGDRTVPIG